MLALTASAQPAIRSSKGVLNASSYATGIAPGSWFVVFGTGMGPATISVYSGAAPYPTQLSGTSVKFTPAGGGTALDARMWYTLAGQVAGMLPSSATPGNYNVTVTYNQATSAPYSVTVVARNFGYATQAQNGAGPAQATYGGLDLNRFTSGTLAYNGNNWTLKPAHIGDTLVLWGTGLGADSASDLNGGTSGDMTAAAGVKVNVGGVQITPSYAGRSSGSPGLDQVNFVLPATVQTGCFAPLSVTAGGQTSNLGSIAIADSGKTACNGGNWTEAQLRKLDLGGTLTVGSLSLSKLTTKLSVSGFSFDSTTETASGSFSKYTVDTIGTTNYSLWQQGVCTVFSRTGTSAQIATGVPPTPLDAGSQLTLNGPGATNMAIPHPAAGDKTYSLTLYSSGFGGFGGSGTPTLAQGTYTIAGAGGIDIGAFTSSLAFPGSFVWTNIDTTGPVIPRSVGMPINWTGGGSGTVTISGFSSVAVGQSGSDTVYNSVGFTCLAPASALTFTVPSSVLLQLPAASSDPTSNSFGYLTVAALSNSVFTAPMTAGGSIDQGFFSGLIGSAKTVGWN